MEAKQKTQNSTMQREKVQPSTYTKRHTPIVNNDTLEAERLASMKLYGVYRHFVHIGDLTNYETTMHLPIGSKYIPFDLNDVGLSI